MKITKKDGLLRLHYLTGINVKLKGISKAGRTFGVPKQTAHYWARKVTNYRFHPAKHGGTRCVVHAKMVE